MASALVLESPRTVTPVNGLAIPATSPQFAERLLAHSKSLRDAIALVGNAPEADLIPILDNAQQNLQWLLDRTSPNPASVWYCNRAAFDLLSDICAATTGSIESWKESLIDRADMADELAFRDYDLRSLVSA